MLNNPELKRHFWLELTPHNLILPPILLVVMFFMILNYFPKPENTAYLAATFIFSIVTVIWGSYLAYKSMATELRNKTWDNQRMSAISPMKLVVGKLIGATIIPWYVGVPCLLTMLYFHHETTLYSVLNLFFIALLSQAVAFIAGLMAARSNVSNESRGIWVKFILVYLFASYFLPSIVGKRNQQINWYGLDYEIVRFTLVSMILILLWAWVAAYRNMQSVLQIKLRPWAMITFIIFLTVYFLGFSTRGLNNMASLTLPYVIIAGLIALPFAYIGAFYEKRSSAEIRRFLHAWQSKSKTAALQETPYFIAVIVFAAACLVLTHVLFVMIDFAISRDWTGNATWLGLTCFILMLRDIGLLFYFSFGKSPEKAVSKTLFYLVMLYIAFPLLMVKTNLSVLFFPLANKGFDANFASAGIALVHFMIVGVLLFSQYQASNKRLVAAK